MPRKVEQVAAEAARSKAKAAAAAQPKTERVPTEAREFTHDSGVIATVNPNVRTLDELLAFMQVDLAIWEVERYTINKWETVMREPATTVGGAGKDALIAEGENGSKATLWTRASNKPLHEPLFQVKAWLKKKSPEATALASLLGQIADRAPRYPKTVRRKVKGDARRSVELCLMDPHVGLLCQRPESDGEWSIPKAAEAILRSMDELVGKAAVFGPFEQVFMPFGNDFVHVDNVFHTTTAGTPQPEAVSWHRIYLEAEKIAVAMVERARLIAPKVFIYEVPGNHSRQSDFTLARLLRAWFRHQPEIVIDASPSPYKFHQFGCNLVGYEHGHSVKAKRLAGSGLMANECRAIWPQIKYAEWHLGDQHRKGSLAMEEQGVSVEYVPGITEGNEWHRLKAFNHQKRGAMAFVWDYHHGPIARLQFNLGCR